MPLETEAAALNKIVVFSVLGQPLRAEIEVSATREELADLKAQLASPDVFKQAGVDYATTLLGIRFNLEKRSKGNSVIKLSSDKPINDPFVDILLELNWPTGRLVREYTFLLDPPEVAAKVFVPVAPATISPAAKTSRSSAPTGAASTIDDELRSKAAASIRTQESVQKATDKSAAAHDVLEVKRGDTLQKIANANKPEGISLEQMLVGLLHANQGAFDGGNMNRLKIGSTLSMPEKSVLEATPTVEARKLVLSQASDWNTYRGKLAGIAAQTPSRETAASQGTTGKITAKVEDKDTPAAESRDQLRLSRTYKARAKSGTAASRREEELAAKEKALEEANDRAAALEKTIADLQKLVVLKDQSLDELQKQINTPLAPVDATKPKSATAAVPQTPADKPNSASMPKPALPLPPPAKDQSLIEELLDNPLALGGGVVILGLIIAFLVARRRFAQ